MWSAARSGTRSGRYRVALTPAINKLGEEYASYFLGHSPGPRGVVSRYNKLSPEKLAKLAEAVDWLGRQLGLVGQA